ncbi:hypothetical protein BJ684DRAFT_22153, partial [Piptocephalis cylindrospora]
MFLHWLVQQGLLSTDQDTNILTTYPLEVRRTMIQPLVQFHASPMGATWCTQSYSVHHVRWTTEVLGAAFTLPIQDAPWSMEPVISVYSRWLVESSVRPLVIQQSDPNSDIKQRFLRDIISHASLIFEPDRGSPLPLNSETLASRSFQAYVECCRKVLKMYAMAGRLLSNDMDSLTWQSLLGIVLGIADRLYTMKSSHPAFGLYRELSEDLMRTLCELWLRSGIHDPPLWSFLSDRFLLWRARSDP